MDSFEGNFASESVYVDAESMSRVVERLYDMHRSRTLCDLSLGVSDAVNHWLPVHRCVLAASSPAFHALLSQLPTPEVRLTVGSVTVVESLIEYMYLGRLKVCLSSARDLLRLGRDYTIGNVVCLVEQHLSKSLSLSTWVEIFRIASEFQLTCIEQQTAEFMAANVAKILEGDAVEQLDYELLRRLLTGSKSAAGWHWKVQVVLRWIKGSYDERASRVAKLFDLVNVEELDAASLKVKLKDESPKHSHDAFLFAVHECLSHADNSAKKLNSTNHRTDKELVRESVAKDLGKVIENDGNAAEQFVKLKEKGKIANGRENTEDGGKCFLRCYRHCSKRKSYLNKLNEVNTSCQSRNMESVDSLFSLQPDNQLENKNESSAGRSLRCAKEPSECVTGKGKNQRTSKSSVSSSENKRTSKRRPSVESLRKQQLLSRSLNAFSVSRRSKATTVSEDGFKRSSRVRRKRAKTADEMYNCPLCPKRFLTCAAQRQHTKGHGCETALLCEVCGFSTRHLASMNVHKQSHYGKRLKCRYEGCTYSAIRSTDLDDHHNAHNGIKSHVCVVCGKAFSGRRHLMRHEKIHTDPRKFACPKCNYRTGRSDKMREHERKHHQPKQNTDGRNSTAVLETETGNGKRRKKTKEILGSGDC